MVKQSSWNASSQPSILPPMTPLKKKRIKFAEKTKPMIEKRDKIYDQNEKIKTQLLTRMEVLGLGPSGPVLPAELR
jgi:hypothetical protein